MGPKISLGLGQKEKYLTNQWSGELSGPCTGFWGVIAEGIIMGTVSFSFPE